MDKFLESLLSFCTGAPMVFLLFFSACGLCYLQKKRPPGFVFFTFASFLPLLGIVPSKLLFFSFINTVNISLLCLYFVMLAALEVGVVADILDAIYRFSRGRSFKFYLSLTAFASFFPSRRMEREILGFLTKMNAKSNQTMHLIFPVLFVLASSLTLLGSATNMVSDYISSRILKGSHWGFFTYGPISLSLFIVSFVFFFAIMRFESRKRALFSLAVDAATGSVPVPIDATMNKSLEQESPAISNSSFTQSKSAGEPGSEKKSSFQKKIVMAILLLLVVLSLSGLQLICVSPLCALLILFVRGLSPKAIAKRLPWDLLLLIVSAFLFCHAFVLTGAAGVFRNIFSHLHGNVSLMTFLLFTAGLFSLVMPSVMVVAIIIPLALAAPSNFSSALSEHLLSCVTVGSFFLFPRRALVSFDKVKDSIDQKIFLFKLQGIWILVVYLVFFIHTLLI